MNQASFSSLWKSTLEHDIIVIYTISQPISHLSRVVCMCIVCLSACVAGPTSSYCQSSEGPEEAPGGWGNLGGPCFLCTCIYLFISTNIFTAVSSLPVCSNSFSLCLSIYRCPSLLTYCICTKHCASNTDFCFVFILQSE